MPENQTEFAELIGRAILKIHDRSLHAKPSGMLRLHCDHIDELNRLQT